MDIESLPNDPNTLKVLLADTDRRLQNALSMVETQKRITASAMTNSDRLRLELADTKRMLQLEIAKNDSLNNKKIRQIESIRFEEMKKATGKSHEKLRDELIDNKIKKDTRETKKILRMRAKLEENENIQDSQKLLLQHLSQTDKAIEDLATAAQNGDLQRCRELIRAGTNINEPDSAGFLPLHYACATGMISVATLLLEHGSDVSSYLTAMSPIEIAAKSGHADMIVLLHKFGANIEDAGAGGSPPIVSACNGGHLNCVKCLADLGADLNAGDLAGLTPLHMSTRLKHPKPIIKFLLSRGADKTRISRAHQTPLQLALSVLNAQAIEALGGKIDPTQSQNDTTTRVSAIKDTIINARTENNVALVMSSQPKPTIRGVDVDAVRKSANNQQEAEAELAPQNSVFSGMTLEDSPVNSIIIT